MILNISLLKYENKKFIVFISNIRSYLGCVENNNEFVSDMETNQMDLVDLVYNTLAVAQDESNSLTECTRTNVHLKNHKDTVETVDTVEANLANDAATPTKKVHSNTSHSTKISSMRRNNIWANRKSWQKDGATISNAKRKLINYADGEYFFSLKLIFLVLIILQLRNQQKVWN